MINLISCLSLGWTWRLVSISSGYIWLTDWQTTFKYLTHFKKKKTNVFLLYFSLKCWMCIKMRKIIFRIDTPFLVHKSKEITSRRDYYILAQIQEITIFPLHVYILIPNNALFSFFFPPVIWLGFFFFFHLLLSATNLASKSRKEPCVAAMELIQTSLVSEVVWRVA